MAQSSDALAAGGGEGQSSLTAAAVAAAVGGRVQGDPEVRVTGVAALDRADGSQLSFYAAERYGGAFASSRAGVVLVTPALATTVGGPATRVIVDNPHEALIALLPRFHRAPPRVPGVHPTAQLGRGVRLGDDVSVGAFVVLGEGVRLGDRVTIESHCSVGAGVEVGDDSHLHPSVVAYPGAVIGRRVILHSGVRVASDGFGYVFRNGRHDKIPHVGRCVIEDDVEIGANTTIDRGSIDDTVIGAGTKIDNLVQIGHNVRVGRLCLLVSQAGIAGSARIEDGCVIGGQAGIAGHHVIGTRARVGAQAGVFGDVPAGETWSGYPARPHKEALRAQAVLFRLAPLMRRLERLVRDPDQ